MGLGGHKIGIRNSRPRDFARANFAPPEYAARAMSRARDFAARDLARFRAAGIRGASDVVRARFAANGIRGARARDFAPPEYAARARSRARDFAARDFSARDLPARDVVRARPTGARCGAGAVVAI